MSEVYTIVVNRRGNEKDVSGTIPELIEYFGYTLEVGQSWQHEKGNKKINRNPETIEELVKNLNNAKKNASANGQPDTYYTCDDVDDWDDEDDIDEDDIDEDDY